MKAEENPLENGTMYVCRFRRVFFFPVKKSGHLANLLEYNNNICTQHTTSTEQNTRKNKETGTLSEKRISGYGKSISRKSNWSWSRWTAFFFFFLNSILQKKYPLNCLRAIAVQQQPAHTNPNTWGYVSCGWNIVNKNPYNTRRTVEKFEFLYGPRVSVNGIVNSANKFWIQKLKTFRKPLLQFIL